MEKDLNIIGKDIIGASFRVHNFMGRFLLEKVYEEALAIELRSMGYHVETQVPIQIEYKGHLLPSDAYKADLIIDDSVIIELKALKSLPFDSFRQLLTYLKLGDKRLGYLINFGAKSLTIGDFYEDLDLEDGIFRLVNKI